MEDDLVAWLDPDRFEDWLRTQPPQAVIGESCSPVADPLANFLSEQMGHAALVGSNRMRVGETVVRLPAWARQYLRLVDSTDRFAPITAEEALRLLIEARCRADEANLTAEAELLHSETGVRGSRTHPTTCETPSQQF